MGYWCKDGYIRTSSKEFSLKSTSRMIHLTNDAVQKKSDDYGRFEAGNKLSYADLQRYIDKNKMKVNFVNDVIPKLKAQALKTIQATFKKLCPK